MDKEQNKCDFNCLTDTMVLDIFQLLTLEELCLAKTVCKRWRRIAETSSLWKVLDVRSSSIKQEKMDAFLKTCIHRSLTILRMQGSVDDSSPSSLLPLSDSFFHEIFSQAPMIKDLHLENYHVSNNHINQMMPSISHLTLSSCSWEENWIQKSSKMLPSLTYLNLSQNPGLRDSDLEDVSQILSLKDLDISSCRNFTDAGIKTLCKTLNQLQYLNLSHTRCTDKSLMMISFSFPYLEKLDLSCCPLITMKNFLQMVQIKTSLKLISLKHIYIKVENINLNQIRNHEQNSSTSLPWQAGSHMDERSVGQMNAKKLEI